MRRTAAALLAPAVAAVAFLAVAPAAAGTRRAGGRDGARASTTSSATTSTTTTADGDPALVREGYQLFVRGCASCHGADGAGTSLAPSLVGVGPAAADFQLSTGRMPLTQPAPVSQRKPPAYPPAQIKALVAYVASLGAGPAIPDPYHPAGDLTAGGELFRLNCASCHSSTGAGGALSYGRDAPPLHAATPVQIAEAMRTGPGPMPVFGPDTLTDRQVNSIVRYVRYLQHPNDRGGLGLGRIGPLTEGLVAIVVGLGLLVLAVRWIEVKHD